MSIAQLEAGRASQRVREVGQLTLWPGRCCWPQWWSCKCWTPPARSGRAARSRPSSRTKAGWTWCLFLHGLPGLHTETQESRTDCQKTNRLAEKRVLLRFLFISLKRKRLRRLHSLTRWADVGLVRIMTNPHAEMRLWLWVIRSWSRLNKITQPVLQRATRASVAAATRPVIPSFILDTTLILSNAHPLPDRKDRCARCSPTIIRVRPNRTGTGGCDVLQVRGLETIKTIWGGLTPFNRRI